MFYFLNLKHLNIYKDSS